MNLLKTPATAAPTQKTRELGVEILRIFSMFFIVAQHLLNHGGFLKNAGEHEIFILLVNVLFAPSVNIFVLITGYFSANSKKIQFGKIATLWLQVLFFSVLMLSVSEAFGVSVNAKTVFQGFMPVINKTYWFFSAYIVLMLLIPYLSAMINAITQKQHALLIVGIFILAFLSSRFGIQSVIALEKGYSIPWFCMLFVIGAYLRKYPVKINKLLLIAVYLCTVFSHMFFKYHLNNTSKFWISMIYSSTDYTQPLTLIASICLLLIFLNIKSNGGRIHRFIIYISSCTFGIYLFHEAPTFRRCLYQTILKTQDFWGRRNSVIYLLIFAAIIFVAGCIIESLRKLLFNTVKRLFIYFKAKDDTPSDPDLPSSNP